MSYCVYAIIWLVNLVCHRQVHGDPTIATPKGVVVTVFAGLLTFALWRRCTFVGRVRGAAVGAGPQIQIRCERKGRTAYPSRRDS